MGKISACVITLNADRFIERCLKSLGFADEIIVVDAGSTDQTVQVAQKYATKVVTNPWQGFAEQRNVGLKHCQGDWVFFLDSDEAVSENLARRLRDLADKDPSQQPNCYSIKRVEYFLGKELHYGPGNPSYQWRFFKQEGLYFKGDVHEYPVFDGPVGEILDPIHHWPYLGIDQFLTKLNHYTTLEAQDRFEQGQNTSLFHAFGTFFTTFFKNGIRYRGFLNGSRGVVLITLESISRVVRHLKLWTMWQVHHGRFNADVYVKLSKPGSRQAPKTEELEKSKWDATQNL